jgi:lysophospholipase L1-like esterase
MNRRTFTLSSLALAACGGGGSGSPVYSGTEVYGDSTGLGVGTDGKNWPESIGAVNRSIGGLAAINLLAGEPGRGVRPFADYMRESTASTVIIALRINDIVNTEPAIYADALRRLSALAIGRRVIFCTSNPTPLPRDAEFAQVMRDVASERGIVLIDMYGLAIPLRDGVHPTAAGYDLMRSFIAKNLT